METVHRDLNLCTCITHECLALNTGTVYSRIHCTFNESDPLKQDNVHVSSHHILLYHMNYYSQWNDAAKYYGDLCMTQDGAGSGLENTMIRGVHNNIGGGPTKRSNAIICKRERWKDRERGGGRER